MTNMEEKETDIKDIEIDLEQTQETLKKIFDIANSLVEVISDTFIEFWHRINGDIIIQYKKLYNQAQWKYIKKGKKYVKVKRRNNEDNARAFFKKIMHHNKKVNKYKN